MEQDDNIDVCCEPVTASAVATDEWENWEEPEIPYEVDFGYPRTVEELKADVEKAWEERNDSSKWLTHEEFWAKLKHDLPWL